MSQRDQSQLSPPAPSTSAASLPLTAASPSPLSSTAATAMATTTATATATAAVAVATAAAAAATTASPTASGHFKFPHYYNFPPLFTLQPNLATRRAQMDKWSALVLAYCRHYRIFRLALGDGSAARASAHPVGPVRIRGDSHDRDGHKTEHDNDADADADAETGGSAAYYAHDLFYNRHIDRGLSSAAVREVMAELRREGRAEYVGDALGDAAAGAAAEVYVYWKKPEEWAALVEAWIDETAQRGSVLTLYELTAGDSTRGTELHGLDPAVLQKALQVLVRRGKAQVFGAEESLGVKFF